MVEYLDALGLKWPPLAGRVPDAGVSVPRTADAEPLPAFAGPHRMRELRASARGFVSGRQKQLSRPICRYVVHHIEWLEGSVGRLPTPEAPGPHSGLLCDARRKVGPNA
jgi:hypothetical protein